MRWPKLSRYTLGYALVTLSCISGNISERLVEEVRNVFAELKKRKSINLDLIPSAGEVGEKGLLEVSCSLVRKRLKEFCKDKSVGTDGSFECLGINQMSNLRGSGKKENCAVSSGKK